MTCKATKYDFPAGTVVTLKGSSKKVKMVVNIVYREQCRTVWFDENGQINYGTFSYDALEKT